MDKLLELIRKFSKIDRYRTPYKEPTIFLDANNK